MASQITDSDSVQFTVHGVRVVDPSNVMQLSINGRPVRPPVLLFVPGTSWRKIVGIIALVIGPMALTFGLIGLIVFTVSPMDSD